MQRPIIYLELVVLFFFITFFAFGQNSNETKPNFIIIFTDDQGYGDLGTFGHPTIKTPNIEQTSALRVDRQS